MNSHPKVTIVVPVRNSEEYIRGLCDSLLAQSYPNIEILLVGNQNDRTWTGIEDYIREGKVRKLEVSLPRDWVGRDTNVKRNYGARAATGNIVVFTDQKIRHKPDWIATGLGIMQEKEAEAVAGIMISTPDVEDTFIGRFTDDALLKRNPAFGHGRFLTKENFGNSESLPITSNWFMSKKAFNTMGGFPEDFRDSYEDYSGAWMAVRNGVRFYCTDELHVYHRHRTRLKSIYREYSRSARGAAQLFFTFPDCPYAQRRLLQIGMILGMAVMALILSVIALPLVLGMSVAGLVSLGLLNMWIARHWQALFFPVLSALFILVFTWHYVLKCLEGGGVARSNQFLQT